MKIAYYCLTPTGEQLAKHIQTAFGGVLRKKECFTDTVLAQDFQSKDVMVFVMATGIVVRKIAPLLRSKLDDPAVIVLGQDGKYVISLLSGHIGGANEMTNAIAALLQAEPVITTATDLQGQVAFDVVAVKNHLVIENPSMIKTISSALLVGECVQLQSYLSVLSAERYPQIVWTESRKTTCKVVISDRLFPEEKNAKPTLYLRPIDLVIGVGCKKEITFDHLEFCFLSFLQAYGYAISSVKTIATIERKRAEPAILQLCETYQIPLQIISDEAIRNCQYPFESSDFVKQVTGLPAVAESCSYLASECGTVLTGKVKYSGVTLAACRCHLPPVRL